jgi:hypothetical protein
MADRALVQLARRKAKKYGVDPAVFVRQISAESGFNPRAGSPAGARGIAQIMPATAKGWGVNLDDNDPRDDLDAAARNMAGYIKKFGSYEKALRAYNAGPGAVEKSRGFSETNNYVAKILGGKDRPATGSERSSRGTPGTDPQWTEKTSFDQAGYDQAVRKARAGAFLAKRRPGSMLGRVLPTEEPKREQFESTGTDFKPGVAATGKDTAGQKGIASAPSGKGKGGLRELFFDPGVNMDEGHVTKAIGGHSDHVHAAFDNAADRRWAEELAHRMGLTVTSEGGGKHAPGSFHYQKLKGGESAALDVGGDPQKMLAYNRLVAQRFRRGKRR